MSAGEKRKRAGEQNSGLSKKSTAVAVMLEDLERLNCPICFELPKAEVYQCSNGHSVCSNCIANLKNCPSCAVPYQPENGPGSGKIRNHFAEDILSTVRFNCSWKGRGCKRQGLTGQQVTEHEKLCSFNPNPIQLCLLLFEGTCNYEVSREFLKKPPLDLPSDFRDHLRTTHYHHPNTLQRFLAGSVLTMLYTRATIEAMLHGGNALFNGEFLCLRDENCAGNPVGLFMLWACQFSSLSDNTKQLTWFVVRVTDPPKSRAVQVKFTLKGGAKSEDNGVLNCETSWDGQILGIQEFYKFKMTAAGRRDQVKFCIPVSYLEQQYLNKDEGLVLQYAFTVKSRGNKN